MGVYIKGMDMPTDGNETIIRIQPGGIVLDQYGHHLAITAITVPPHGRLIDADALMDSDGDVWDDMWGWSGVKISDAPTIIPEEGVKN